MQETPVLKLADPDRPYRVETDASNFAIGGVLLQQWGEDWLPVTFISRKLKDAEKNYNVYDRELLAFVHALRKWRCYLLGLQVEVFTDHHTLTKILDQKELTGRQARWAELLAEYHISISYRKGTQNIVADALSRRADHVNQVEEGETELEELQKGYAGDLDFGRIVEIKDPNRYDNPKHANKHFPEYRLEKGILYKGERICVPLTYRGKVLREAHDSPSGGHPGGRRTYLAIRENFYWPNMKREIEDYARTCDICQKDKPDNQRKRGLLHPLPSQARPKSTFQWTLSSNCPEPPEAIPPSW